MGLRAASVRHSNAVVMAPALTEAGQSQNFTLPPSSPINNVAQNGDYVTRDDVARPLKGNVNGNGDSAIVSKYLSAQYTNDLFNSLDKLNNSSLVAGRLKTANLKQSREASEGNKLPSHLNIIMSDSPTSMGDQEDTMGLQKAGMEAVASLLKDKSISNDVEQLLNNLDSVMPGADMGGAGDIGQNVDDLMQVIKNMEVTAADGDVPQGDGMDATPADTVPESEVIFPIALMDRDLFGEVDMMTMCEDEPMTQESASATKESRAKETIEELYKKQVKLERRSEFLLRRLRKLQARAMGKHVSGEVVGLFEHIHRTIRRAKETGKASEPSDTSIPSTLSVEAPQEVKVEEPIKPVSSNTLKNLVKKLELTAVVQSNVTNKHKGASRYFGSGSLEHGAVAGVLDSGRGRSLVSGTVSVPRFSTETRQELERVSGLLHSEIAIVEQHLDSDATASSSGGESCDEMQTYNNPHQQFLSTSKRAAWRYANERAQVASRWAWLQAQISDLEYRIRQHNDLHRQIRACKGAVTLCEPSNSSSTTGSTSPMCQASATDVSPSAVNGYRGQLPGATPQTKTQDEMAVHNGTMTDNTWGHSARTRPMNKSGFRKRKLIQTTGLHALSKKAGRPSNIRCGCVEPVVPCALCTGRADPTFPRDMPEQLTVPERIALLDPGYHPILSFSEDVPQSIHIEAVMKLPDWQQRSIRSSLKQTKAGKSDRTDKTGLDGRPKKSEHRRKYTRLLKNNNTNSLNPKMKHKLSRGRKPFGRSSSLSRVKKRHTAKVAMAQLQALAAESVDEEMEALSGAPSTAGDSLTPSPLSHVQVVPYRRNRVNSYDIDNIVIPYSVAASTRVEKLQYKEILTPKWRVVDVDFPSRYDIKNNGMVRRTSQDSDVEDVTDDAVSTRHEKSEHEERKKFLSYIKFPLSVGRPRANRRTDSRAESSGANTPDPMSPHTGEPTEPGVSPLTSPPATPLSVTDETSQSSQNVLRRRTVSQSRWAKDRERVEMIEMNVDTVEVPPYELRVFPLNDETYDKMLKNMPDGHPLPYYLQKQLSKDSDNPVSPFNESVCSPVSDSTESFLAEEDPNDPEWVDVERVRDRTKR